MAGSQPFSFDLESATALAERATSILHNSSTFVKAVLAAIVLVGISYAASKPKNPQIYPVWAILELAITASVVGNNSSAKRLYERVRRYGGSLYGMTSKHQVLIGLPNLDRILSQSAQIIDPMPSQYTLLTRVFGAMASADLQHKLATSGRDFLVPVERMFLNDASATVALEKAEVAKQVTSLVSFSTNRQDQKRWERSANIVVLKPDDPEGSGVAEADLQSIVRDLGACIAIPLLYGRDFLERYETLLEDFWKFDNDIFAPMMVGVPPWAPFKLIREGVAARTRLATEVEALCRRINQHQQGQKIDFDADMSDISQTALSRNALYNRDNWSFGQRASGELALLWGQNANTQPILFWFLTYIYSTPGLLESIRDEIGPHVTLVGGSRPEITKLDLACLSRDCPLFKACIFETYRMANEAASIRFLHQPITITEGDHKQTLLPGTFVSAPHSVIQKDSSLFPDPEDFQPRRFLKTDPDTGKSRAQYGSIRPWGAGNAICKGRTFAEKEIIALGAAIISLWDISPAGGEWKLPKMMPGTGAKKPANDIRVVIRRRSVPA